MNKLIAASTYYEDGIRNIVLDNTYAELPLQKHRVTQGAILQLQALLNEATTEHPNGAKFIVADDAIARARSNAGEPGSLQELQSYLLGPWLQRLHTEIDILHIQRQSSRDLLLVALENSSRKLSAQQLMLLADLHFGQAQSQLLEKKAAYSKQNAYETKTLRMQLGPVIRTCAEFEERFGDEHPLAVEILYLHAWALLDPTSDYRDDVEGGTTLARLLKASERRNNTPLADEARLLLAEVYFETELTEKAIPLYQALSAEDASDHRKVALYKLGWCHYRIQQYNRSMSAFGQLLDEPEASEIREDALRGLAAALVSTYAGEDMPAAIDSWILENEASAHAQEIWLAAGTVAVEKATAPVAISALNHIISTWPKLPDNPHRLHVISGLLTYDAPTSELSTHHERVLELLSPSSEWWAANSLKAHESAAIPLYHANLHLGDQALSNAKQADNASELYRVAADHLGAASSFDPSSPVSQQARLSQSYALFEGKEEDAALHAWRGIHDLPPQSRCGYLELGLTLSSAASPENRPPNGAIEDLAQQYVRDCAQDKPKSAAHSMTLAAMLASEHYARAAGHLLLAGWKPLEEDKQVTPQAQAILALVLPDNPMAAFQVCVEIQRSKKLKPCRQARRTAGRSIILNVPMNNP